MPLKLKEYLLLCLAVAIVTATIVLFVPGLSDTIESRMLTFLTTITRA
ncbi:MAG: hypothetical protein CM1200mP40_07440 [Gammaproteobacteria bacterium]|jgi:hypothetical protein|nr:MAG: hypothetical protein CM1200mP40_07440 [Gammaproteobacteria bacterium]